MEKKHSSGLDIAVPQEFIKHMDLDITRPPLSALTVLVALQCAIIFNKAF